MIEMELSLIIICLVGCSIFGFACGAVIYSLKEGTKRSPDKPDNTMTNMDWIPVKNGWVCKKDNHVASLMRNRTVSFEHYYLSFDGRVVNGAGIVYDEIVGKIYLETLFERFKQDV